MSSCSTARGSSVHSHPVLSHPQDQYSISEMVTNDEKTVKKKWKDRSSQIVDDLIQVFESIQEFKAEFLEEAFKKYLEEKELGFGVAMIALRLSLTGLGGGPSLFKIAEIIGKSETIRRLNENSQRILALKGN